MVMWRYRYGLVGMVLPISYEKWGFEKTLRETEQSATPKFLTRGQRGGCRAKLACQRGSGCGPEKEVNHIMQMMTIGDLRRIFHVLSCISKRTKEDCERGCKNETVHFKQNGLGKGQLLVEPEEIWLLKDS